MQCTFKNYVNDGFYDEMFDERGNVRKAYAHFKETIENLSLDDLLHRQSLAESALMSMGITFNVYSESEGRERIFPIDIIPRIIEKKEWKHIEAGLKQRIKALNLFINDVYNDQLILKDDVVPRDLVESSEGFLKPCIGLKPPKDIWCHITGTDLIRGADGTVMVLEDNLRCPSGVSYMLENREVLKRTFPKMFETLNVQPVFDYSNNLRDMLQFISGKAEPTVVVLTPGIYNSAYFEHSYLAQQMGVELVSNNDLVVDRGFVKMRTTKGLKTVDVIYRRIDDNFLDPTVFRKDTLLGVPDLFNAYKRKRLALANAPGTGVADDKVVYAYVPRIIKYYLGQEPILPNVKTFICREEEDRKYVLDNIEELVVKEANEAGGYGMMIGPKADKATHEEFRNKIKANPRNYIAQPTISLSRVPTIIENNFEGRHVDLRPYILYGDDIKVVPGGLTRVALRKGSLVVNSSQGGGSKDTWVLR